jgi:hypothetical protein
MEISRVLRSLREVGDFIDTRRTKLEAYKAWVSTVSSDLTGLASTYADVVTEINGYTPTGAAETYCKDVLAKLVAERSALLSDVNTLVSDLSALTEF